MVIINPRRTKNDRVLEETVKLLPDWYTGALGWRLLTAISDTGAILGTLAWDIVDEIIYIKWIYVIKEHRRQFVASTLIDSFLDMLLEADYMGEIILQYDRSISEGLYEFVDSLPWFDQRLYYTRLSIDIEECLRDDNCKKMMDYAKKYPVKSLSGVSDGILKSNVANINSHSDYKIGNTRLWLEDIDRELSFARIEDGKINSAVIVSKQNCDYHIDLIFAKGAINVAALFGSVLLGLKKKGEAINIFFEPVNDVSKELATKLVPFAKKAGDVYEGRWNYLAPSIWLE